MCLFISETTWRKISCWAMATWTFRLCCLWLRYVEPQLLYKLTISWALLDFSCNNSIRNSNTFMFMMYLNLTAIFQLIQSIWMAKMWWENLIPRKSISSDVTYWCLSSHLLQTEWIKISNISFIRRIDISGGDDNTGYNAVSIQQKINTQISNTLNSVYNLWYILVTTT